MWCVPEFLSWQVKLALVHASLDGKRYSWCASGRRKCLHVKACRACDHDGDLPVILEVPNRVSG